MKILKQDQEKLDFLRKHYFGDKTQEELVSISLDLFYRIAKKGILLNDVLVPSRIFEELQKYSAGIQTGQLYFNQGDLNDILKRIDQKSSMMSVIVINPKPI